MPKKQKLKVQLDKYQGMRRTDTTTYVVGESNPQCPHCKGYGHEGGKKGRDSVLPCMCTWVQVRTVVTVHDQAGILVDLRTIDHT
jgi:hypothetical protein